MSNINSWEAQTKELLNIIERQMKEIQGETEKRLAILQEKRWGILQALEAYSEFMGSAGEQSFPKISPEELKDKTYREALRLIAQRNGGLLVAKNAINLLKEYNRFGDSLNPDSIIYSVLNRSPEFVRLGRGVYRLNGLQKKAKTTTRKERIPGLKQEILKLKTVNPDMTKQDVRDTLVKRGFDFKGKNPNKVVHIFWVNLGYARKDKEAQQSLFRTS